MFFNWYDARKFQDTHGRDQSHDREFENADWTVEAAEHGNGGLRNAVKATLAADTDLDITWVGTLGMPTDVLTDKKKADIDGRLETEYDSLTVFCKDSDFDGHYIHYCKQVCNSPVFTDSILTIAARSCGRKCSEMCSVC